MDRAFGAKASESPASEKRTKAQKMSKQATPQSVRFPAQRDPIEQPVSPAQAAAFLGIAERTLRDWQRTKGLPVRKLSYRVKRYFLSELSRWAATVQG